MKVKICVTVVGMAVLLSGGSLRAGAQDACAPPAEFVGVTSVGVSGSVAGHLVFAQACQAEFVGSHVCTSSEIMQSGRTPIFPAGFASAWVNPSVLSTLPDNSDRYTTDAFFLIDASGVVLKTRASSFNNLTCGGPRSSLGLTVNSNGGFAIGYCGSTTTLPVACCVGRAGR